MPRRDTRPEVAPHPRYVVWELTLKCDLACRHCGSRAGRVRESELGLDEARAIVHQLADMGTQEITFIGGEAYLFPEWLAVVREAARAGIRCTMTTGARGLTEAMAKGAADVGMQGMSVSIDGLEETHDRLRAVKGSWRKAMDALGLINKAGMVPMTNTQWNRLNLPELEDMAERFMDAGSRAWQVQLTGPMGRAADRPDLLLQPYQILDLVPRLAAVARAGKSRSFRVEAANNLGYFGPFEQDLRRAHWKGCQAGRYVLGIEANGDVKGCPSLPSAPYVGGNLREHDLRHIWETTAELRFSRDRTTDELWGFCKSCYYADLCRGGCSWTAHTALGRRGNMPWCFHRAETLRERGQRERIERVEAAAGDPFDFGRFQLVLEPYDSASVSINESRSAISKGL